MKHGPEEANGVKKKFQKSLILVFEVIVQSYGEKCETKIMKIVHSVLLQQKSLHIFTSKRIVYL